MKIINIISGGSLSPDSGAVINPRLLTPGITQLSEWISELKTPMECHMQIESGWDELYPECLYLSPADDCGDQVIDSSAGMKRLFADLKKGDSSFSGLSLSDCEEFYRGKQMLDGRFVYTCYENDDWLVEKTECGYEYDDYVGEAHEKVILVRGDLTLTLIRDRESQSLILFERAGYSDQLARIEVAKSGVLLSALGLRLQSLAEDRSTLPLVEEGSAGWDDLAERWDELVDDCLEFEIVPDAAAASIAEVPCRP